MSTHYYVNFPPCPTCHSARPPLHIGRSAAGWRFLLYTYPDLRNFGEWVTFLLSNKDSSIQNEYGEKISSTGLILIITQASKDVPLPLLHMSGSTEEGNWDLFPGNVL